MAKSKSTATILSSHVPTSSSSASSPIASESPGILVATGKLESRMRRNSKSNAASSSKVRLQDAYLGWLMDTATGKLVATEEDSGEEDISESETGSEEDVTGKPVACQTATEKPCASSAREVQKLKGENGHTTCTCLQPQVTHGSSLLDRQGIYGREHDDPMDDLEVNMATWGISLNASLRAAVHLGQDFEADLRYVKNHLLCANKHALWVAPQGGKGEFTSCRGTVQSAWQKPPVRRNGGRTVLPARVSDRHVVWG